MNYEFWENYYQNNRIPVEESRFARFVAELINGEGILIELGCGNGRDALYLSKVSKNLKVLAVDQCNQEMEFLKSNYSNANLDFVGADFTNLSSLDLDKARYLYSRFTLHAITKAQQSDVFRDSFELLEKHGKLFLEVRSTKDPLFGKGQQCMDDPNAFVTDHYRRFVEINEILTELIATGFTINYAEQNIDFAPYQDDNPEVIRIVAQKL